MACLTVLDGSLKGQRFTLTLPLTRIGRREGNDWVVQDGSISGTHCEIEKSDDGFLIRDLGSTNGTKVNNVTIKEKALSRNDIILLGEVPMMIEGDDVPQSEKESAAVPRTTIIIQPKRTLETPKEFGKKTNSNKLWVAVIVVLVLVIAYLLVQLFVGGGATGAGG
ncbi:MAG: FHA domain-containing protein [Kiritimatiellae bacterium]|jgi:hypothetical protein|nr:FHA domain-containing protein [Kiritimatiellia bacterium]MDD2347521.1 FHA domain-containing protein [Kiritimatiellia bacterium]MDD3583847.1 FHA domain-containing protein [Kiritimatiellia bacterium]HHU14153.1 FHA domain-containing protein [Lentisphaerota bacterium]HON46899.1 FHA domain-containing protein [Kiritimatiellia bacterium]